MKHLKTMLLGLCCIAVMSLTSCLSNDNNNNSNNGLTPQEKAVCAAAVRGYYSGEAYTYADGNATKLDTLKNLTWGIVNDTTMIIYDFPPALLAYNISNTDLKEALKAAAPQDIEGHLYYVNVSPVGFYVIYEPIKLNLFYGDTHHDVTIYLNHPQAPYYLASGAYDASKPLFQVQMYENAVIVDTDTSNGNISFHDSYAAVRTYNEFLISGKKQ